MRCFGMGKGRFRLFWTSSVLLLGVLACLICIVDVSADELNAGDCGLCHGFQMKMVALGGGKHATEIGCNDCHSQHLGKLEPMIASCDDCHDGQSHYRSNNCQHCHVDAHMPLFHLRDPVKPARQECLSCHTEVGEKMTAEPSRHAQLFCNRCHQQHKEVPQCQNCHPPHLQSQSSDDCLNCHPAHRPLAIALVRYVPIAFCRTCHALQAQDLAVNTTHHGRLNCIDCHKGRHTMILECRDCHGLPHVMALHRKHTSCQSCHGSAHQLVSGR